MSLGILHVEKLEMILLIGHNNVDVALTCQAVVHCTEQTVSIWWEVNPDNLGRLVGDNVEETRVLVSEAVVVLTPYSAKESQ